MTKKDLVFCLICFLLDFIHSFYEWDALFWIDQFYLGRNPYTMSFPFKCAYPLWFLVFGQLRHSIPKFLTVVNISCFLLVRKMNNYKNMALWQYLLSFYCIWHFDFVVLICIKVGLMLISERRYILAGIVFGFGTGIKYFPIIVLIWLFFRLDLYRFSKVGISALVFYSLPYIILPDYLKYYFSPYLFYCTLNFSQVILLRLITPVMITLMLIGFVVSKGNLKRKFEYYYYFMPTAWTHHYIYYDQLFYKKIKGFCLFVYGFFFVNYILTIFIETEIVFLTNIILNNALRVWFIIQTDK